MYLVPANPMRFVTACVVSVVCSGVVCPAVTAREAEKRHRGHAGGTKNDTEDVQVHLIE
jgi:hypothetical protein